MIVDSKGRYIAQNGYDMGLVTQFKEESVKNKRLDYIVVRQIKPKDPFGTSAPGTPPSTQAEDAPLSLGHRVNLHEKTKKSSPVIGKKSEKKQDDDLLSPEMGMPSDIKDSPNKETKGSVRMKK